jgi:hypothetical protein
LDGATKRLGDDGGFCPLWDDADDGGTSARSSVKSEDAFSSPRIDQVGCFLFAEVDIVTDTEGYSFEWDTAAFSL